MCHEYLAFFCCFIIVVLRNDLNCFGNELREKACFIYLVHAASLGNTVEAPRRVAIGEGRELVVGDWWPQERFGVEPSLHHLGRENFC